MLTICPACLTTHRVTEAQWARPQSLVRCSQCQLVFNVRDMGDIGSGGEVFPAAEDFLSASPTPHTPQPVSVAQLESTPLTMTEAVDGGGDGKEDGGLKSVPPLASSAVSPFTLVRVLGLFSVLVLLAVQIAVIERSALQRHLPGFYLVLTEVCAPLGCLAEAARLADTVAIAGSALDTMSGDQARLSVTLANRGRLRLAWPHLVLTLQDAQGQRVAVRTLAPQDYLPVDAPAALHAGTELESRVLLGLGDTRPVGYSVAVLYP